MKTYLLIVAQIFIYVACYPQYTKSLYVELFPRTILGYDGDSNGTYEREDQLLQYAQSRGYNSLILYDMQQLFTIYYEQSLSSTDKTNLARFIKKAKSQYGITEIATTIGANWNYAYDQPNIVHSQVYNWINPSGSFTDLGNGNNFISNSLNLPFTFYDLEGNAINQIYASSNGYIELQTTINCITCTSATYVPNPLAGIPKNMIAGLWDDLNILSSSTFRYFVNGTTPNRIAVVEWNNVKYFNSGSNNGNACFQIQIFEDGHFEIHIKSGSENPVPTNQTIGFNNSDGSIGAAALGQINTQTYRNLVFVSTNNQAWSFVLSEARDWGDKNMTLYNSSVTDAQERIDAISLEMEFWGTQPSNYKWESVKYFQRQLQITFDLEAASTYPFKIIPYLNKFDDTYEFQHDLNSQVTISAKSLIDFIDERSDIVILTNYFADEYLKQTGQTSYFGFADYYNGLRFERFADNPFTTKIRVLMSGEDQYFGKRYLNKLWHVYLVDPTVSPITWDDQNGVTHTYDDEYFQTTLTEDKAFHEFLGALSESNPHQLPLGGTTPCGSSTNSLLCTMGPPFGNEIDGNEIEGHLWYRYGVMPEANFYTNGPSNTNVVVNQTHILSSSDILSTMPVSVGRESNKDKWYKWMQNPLGPGHHSFVQMEPVVNTSTITVPNPHFYKTDKYLHEIRTTSATYFDNYKLRNQMNLTTLIVPSSTQPHQQISVVSKSPATCPNYNNGSVTLKLLPDSSIGDTILQSKIFWTKDSINFYSSDSIVNLPFTFSNLTDGNWKVLLTFNGDSIIDSIYIDKIDSFKPQLLANYAGANCGTKLSTTNYQSYLWKLNGISVSTGPNYNATQDGTYTLTATNSEGCIGTSNEYNLEIAPTTSFSIESYDSTYNILTLSIENYNDKHDYLWIATPEIKFEQDGSICRVYLNKSSNAEMNIVCKVTNECGVSRLVSTRESLCEDTYTYIDGQDQSSMTPDSIITREGMTINGTFHITRDFTFKNCGKISFAPGAKILVHPGVTLTIDSCLLESSDECCQMWRGIELAEGIAVPCEGDCPEIPSGQEGEYKRAYLVLKNNTVISQAEFGVNLNNRSKFHITNTSFKNNYIGVLFNTGSNMSNPGCIIYSCEFYSTPIECKELNYSSFLPKYSNQITNPYNRPLAGIYVNRVIDINLGSNIYNNLSNGIVINKSGVEVNQSRFSNIIAVSDYDSLNFKNGSAISSNGSITEIYGIGGSMNDDPTFSNCDYAVALQESESRITDIYSSNSCKVGLYFRNCDLIEVENNTIGANHYGIWGFYNPNCSLYIQNNSILMSPNINGVAGIRLDEFGIQNVISVTDNEVFQNKSLYGIHCAGVVGGNFQNNVILMNNSENGPGMYFSYSSYNNINCNTVYASNLFGLKQSGLGISMSTDNLINCNLTDMQYNGFRFYGPCSNTLFRGNVIGNHTFGLSLTYNAIIGEQYNTGNQWIGSYGSYGAYLSGFTPTTSEANRFQFDPNVSSTNSTLTNTDGVTDWFVSNSDNYEFVCEEIECLPLDPSEFEFNTNLIVASQDTIGSEYTESTNYFADQFLYEKLSEDSLLLSSNSIYQAFYSQHLTSNIGIFSEFREGVEEAVTSKSVYEFVLSTNLGMIEMYNDTIDYLDSLYNIIYDDKILDDIDRLNDSIVVIMSSNDSLNSIINGLMEYYLEILNEVNNEISPNETYEDNEQIVNDVLLQTVVARNYQLNNNQLSDLLAIAVQCPFSGGPSVYFARSLYSMTNPLVTWDDDDYCILSGIYPRLSKTNEVQSFNIFPNPANDNLHINYVLPDERNARVEVYNILGSILLSEELSYESNSIAIKVNYLEPGLYYVRIISSNSILFTEKFVKAK